MGHYIEDCLFVKGREYICSSVCSLQDVYLSQNMTVVTFVNVNMLLVYIQVTEYETTNHSPAL
jgi:hypothetical protein